MKRIQWIASAALSAYACHLVVLHATLRPVTPIDHALPLLALAVTALAAVSYPAVMLAVPLLMVSEFAIADEATRLFAFGVVVAAAFAVTVVKDEAGQRWLRPLVVTVVALVVLRWIPLADVMIGRELVLVAVALAIVVILGGGPIAVAVAVAAALATPAIPLRTLALPLLVLFVAFLARVFGLPRLRLAIPTAAILGFMMLFFAWSGVTARALPWFLRVAEKKPAQRTVVQRALTPGEAVRFDVPPAARALIISGGNIAHLSRGALLGRIEPGGLELRIGNVADWGYTRREHYYGTRNPLPSDPAGRLQGYGYGAWVGGAGRLALPDGAHSIVVTADAALPAGSTLQVEGFE